jgi:hypothetical protein
MFSAEMVKQDECKGPVEINEHGHLVEGQTTARVRIKRSVGSISIGQVLRTRSVHYIHCIHSIHTIRDRSLIVGC